MSNAITRNLRRIPLGGTDGFSVMEMLVVFTVVGIAMIPLAAIQFSSRTEVREADQMSLATEVALTRLEQIKLDGFASTVADTLQDDPFTIITTVTPDTLNPFLRELSVRVVWEAIDGERGVTMASMQSAVR